MAQTRSFWPSLWIVLPPSLWFILLSGSLSAFFSLLKTFFYSGFSHGERNRVVSTVCGPL